MERPQNKTLLALVDEYGIGQRVGSRIIYTESCFSALRSLYQRSAKGNEFIPRTAGKNKPDRIEKSKVSLNEKSGSAGVFDRFLLLAAYRRDIPLADGKQIPVAGLSGVTVMLEAKQIDFSRIERLVVVENGSMLSALYSWNHLLPEHWQDAVFVYRGHKSNSAELNAVIRSLPPQTEVGVYADHDLGGLSIVAGYAKLRPVVCFVPEQLEKLKRTSPHNNEDAFERQAAALRMQYPNQDLNVLARFMVKNRIAIMQENFEALGALKAMPLK